jgi:hypothetical protein
MSKSMNAGWGRFVCVALVLSAALLLCALHASAATEKVLFTFQGYGDGTPNGDLVFDAAGNLYGTNNVVNGTVFELSPDGSGGWTKTTIYSFQGGNDGEQPQNGVVFDAAGNLYGATAIGGSSFCGGRGCGTIFKLAPDNGGGWTESVLYSFTGGRDGEGPVGSLVLDGAGNLYGAAVTAGGGNGGTAFELSPEPGGGWSERTIFTFGSRLGESPSPLIRDSSGNLYGTAGGGVYNGGAVFELVPTSSGQWGEHLLYNFAGGVDGAFPIGGLVRDRLGNLYGVTLEGGTYSEGTVFEVVRLPGNGWQKKTLHEFGSAIGGQTPNGGLILDARGNLYGLTEFGGVSGCTGRPGCGLAFELSPHASSWSEKVLTDFSANVDGGFPSAGLTLDGEGNLYGATQGGSGTVAFYGAIFEIIP